MTRAIILGIDPGTTVGYAVFDIHGKVLESGEEKGVALADLIKRVTQHGSVALVGTDKAKTPTFVKKVATTLGAQVWSPQKDVLQEEKHKLRKKKGKGHHEYDALVCGDLASRSLQSLLRRIEGKRIPRKLHNDIVLLVMREHIAIADAYLLLTRVPETKNVLQKIHTEKQNMRPLAMKLIKAHQEIDRLNTKVAQLKEKNQKVKDAKRATRTPATKIKKQLQQARDLLQRERLKNTTDAKKQKKLETYLTTASKYLFIPRYKTISRRTKLKKDSWIHVKDPTGCNPELLLSAKTRGIIFGTKPPKKITDLLPTIREGRCSVEELTQLTVINKKKFEQELRKKDLLTKVIRQYRRKRQ